MTVVFKSRRKYYIFDSTSGYISELSRLENEIFSYIDLPMPALCPTTLRYDLAKYDSEDVANAYGMFYKLYTSQKIFSADSKSDITLCLDYLNEVDESVARDALDTFFNQANRRIAYKLSDSPLRILAEDVAAEHGMKVC